MATATRPAAAPRLVAGLLPRDPALETYPVRPGGATMIVLRGDDRMRITDRHGGHANSLGITDQSLASTTGTSTRPSVTWVPSMTR